jgi:hypothetical protein
MINKQENSPYICQKELLELIKFVNFHRGFLNGMRRMLSIMLKGRFGLLSKDVIERLKNADAETLENWGLALLNAQTLDDVFIKTDD